MSQHCFSKWLHAWQLHYLNQCWLTISMAHWQSPDSNITRYPSHQLPRLAWKLLISLKSSRGQWDNLSNFLRNLVIHVAGIGRHVFVFEKCICRKSSFSTVLLFLWIIPQIDLFLHAFIYLSKCLILYILMYLKGVNTSIAGTVMILVRKKSQFYLVSMLCNDGLEMQPASVSSGLVTW